MKKEVLILLGLGAAAFYFFTKRKRGFVEVYSPEKIREEEFGTPTMREAEEQPIVDTGKNIFQSVKDIVQKTKTDLKRKKALKDVMYIPGTNIRVSKKQFEKTIRQQKAKVRQQKRAESRIRRKAKRQKVGEISIMY